MKRSLIGLTLMIAMTACSDGWIGEGNSTNDTSTGGSPSTNTNTNTNTTGGSSGLGEGGSSNLNPGLQPTNWQTLLSDEPRANPSLSAAELQAFSQGNREFAIDLYQLLGESEDGNVLISPTSIRAALSMTYAGAKGETATQMETALHFPSGDAAHEGFNALDFAFEARNLPAGDDADPVQLSVVNSFWGQEGYPWLDSFLDTLGRYYGSGAESVDFKSAPEECRELINTWVEDETHDRIQDLLPENSISTNTVAVLVNAVYFKAPWDIPFEESLTQPGTFHNLEGADVAADFMHQTETVGYASGSGYQATELLFRGDALSMVFIVPEAGTFSTFEAGLDVEQLDAILTGLAPTMVELSVPKFEFEFGTVPLSGPLNDLGMVLPFTDAADFSGMLQRSSLYIDEVYHKTFIAIDEKGAEAAAATAVVMDEAGVPTATAELTIDRPFFVAIRDISTENLLFFGRVLDPSQ